MARRPEEIGLNAPTEAIDVPRSTTYAPVEFSGQIAATQEGRSSLAEIPKSAAGIVLAHNEYKRTEKEGDIALDDTQDALNQKELEETFKLSENNRVQAMSMQMLDTMDKRRKEALADPNGSIYNATQEVFEEYEMPDEFLNSPYAMAQWQNMHSNYQKTLAPKAFDTDRERETARMDFNIKNQLGIATGMIHSGSTFEEAFTNYMKQISNYKGVMDDKKFIESVNSGGQSLLQTQLAVLVTQAKTENWDIDRINVELKRFRDTYNQMTFAWTDTADKPIMEGDKQATFDLFMNAQTHDKIGQFYGELVTRAASKSKAGVSVDIGQHDKAIDWAEFKKTGYNGFLRRTSRDEIPTKLTERVNEIKAAGGGAAATDKKVKDAVKKYGAFFISKSIADSINASNMSPSAISQFTTRLDMDINKGGYPGDWLDYKCTIKVGDQTLTVELPEEIKQYITSDEQALVLWKEATGHLSNLAKSGAKSADFLSTTNSTYSSAETNVVALAVPDPDSGQDFRSRFIRSVGDGKFRPKYENSELTDAHIIMSQTAEGLDAGQAGLSTNMISAAKYTLDNIDNEQERLAGAMVWAQAWKDTGYAASFLLTESPKNGAKDQNDISDSSMMLQGAIFWDKTQYEQVSEAMEKGLSIKGLSKTYQTGDARDNSRRSIIASVINKNNVPSSMYKALFYACDIYGQALAQNATTTSEQDYRTQLERATQDMIDRSFHTFSSGTHMRNKVYKYSRQMFNQDLPRLDKAMSKTIDYLRPFFDTRLISFQPNAETGDFDIALDGQVIAGISSSGEEVPIASMITEYTRQGKTDTIGRPIEPEKLGALIAMRTFMGILATDDLSIQQQYDKARKTIGGKEAYKQARGPLVSGEDRLYMSMAQRLSKGSATEKVFADAINTGEATAEFSAHDIKKYRENAARYLNVLSKPDLADIYLMSHKDPSAWVMTGRKTIVRVADAMKKEAELKYAPDAIHSTKHTQIIDVMHWAEQFMTDAHKVSQGNASLPMAAAAVGEDYHDQRNAAKTAGYNISGVDMDGIANTDPIEDEDEEDDIGVPTGMAAPIAPRKMEYTKAELQTKANRAADKYQIPRSLMNALVVQESGYKVDAKSKAGASGLMQLMPATAKSLGVTDIFDVDQNIDAGARYLQQQYKRFGSWPLALAAYNAGPGAVDDYLNGTNFTGGNPKKRKTGGIPNYPETQNYVKNIMAKSGLNKNTYGINFSIAGNINRFIDRDMGMLSVSGVSKFLDMLNGTNAYKGKIDSISTNRRELLEDKPEYRDFAKFRAMKTADGKPLFVAGDVDGFRVNMKKQGGSKLNPAADLALAEDAVNNQADIFEPVSHETARTLLRLFDNRYELDGDKKGNFGLANLSVEEYNRYGIPLNCMDNPIFQNRVLVHEFQRANDLLGSERKAIFALAGGDLRTPEGEVKSWKDIKSDDMAYEKEWYIAPSADDKRRNTINEVLAMFDKLRDYATKEA
jgi:hypothetical protein